MDGLTLHSGILCAWIEKLRWLHTEEPGTNSRFFLEPTTVDATRSNTMGTGGAFLPEDFL